jgi:hypothetical protein
MKSSIVKYLLVYFFTSLIFLLVLSYLDKLMSYDYKFDDFLLDDIILFLIITQAFSFLIYSKFFITKKEIWIKNKCLI